MSKRLEGKVELMTGCGSVGPGWGNGKAISALFAREGASIFGCDIKIEAAEETQRIVRAEGGEIEVMRCDVATAEQVKLDFITAKFA